MAAAVRTATAAVDNTSFATSVVERERKRERKRKREPDDWGALGFGRIAEMVSGGPELGRLCRALAETLRVDEGAGVLCAARGE